MIELQQKALEEYRRRLRGGPAKKPEESAPEPDTAAGASSDPPSGEDKLAQRRAERDAAKAAETAAADGNADLRSGDTISGGDVTLTEVSSVTQGAEQDERKAGVGFAVATSGTLNKEQFHGPKGPGYLLLVDTLVQNNCGLVTDTG